MYLFKLSNLPPRKPQRAPTVRYALPPGPPLHCGRYTCTVASVQQVGRDMHVTLAAVHAATPEPT